MCVLKVFIKGTNSPYFHIALDVANRESTKVGFVYNVNLNTFKVPVLRCDNKCSLSDILFLVVPPGARPVTGSQLLITEDMMGFNRWECQAINIAPGAIHPIKQETEFDVGK